MEHHFIVFLPVVGSSRGTDAGAFGGQRATSCDCTCDAGWGGTWEELTPALCICHISGFYMALFSTWCIYIYISIFILYVQNNVYTYMSQVGDNLTFVVLTPSCNKMDGGLETLLYRQGSYLQVILSVGGVDGWMIGR